MRYTHTYTHTSHLKKSFKNPIGLPPHPTVVSGVKSKLQVFDLLLVFDDETPAYTV